MYMGFLTILGSLLLYAGGRLRYIDALFFGSGAATQSGLNTYTPMHYRAVLSIQR